MMDWKDRRFAMKSCQYGLRYNMRELANFVYPERDSDDCIHLLSALTVGSEIEDADGDLWVRVV